MNRAYFFARIRESLFGGKLSKTQVDGVTRLLDVWEAEYSQNDYRWLAYILATVKWETNHTMLPVREIGKGKARRYGVPTGPYKKIYYGRGDVQLTWEKNYRRMSAVVGHDLVKDPDLALKPEISAKIVFEGMIRGLFTGKKLPDYINGEKCDFVGARRIVNGTDKAAMIAGYATSFAEALYQAQQEPEEEAEYIEGDQTTGTPPVESSTIWAQVLSWITTGGASLLAGLGALDWKIVAIVAVCATLAFGAWTISERLKHSKENGV